jgi:uncharacterized protein YbjT (DUF2867 family)
MGNVDMTKVLVLGAGGQIAQWVVEALRNDGTVRQTLFLRHARKLRGPVPRNARVIEGDVLDRGKLDGAMADQDIVYANLTGGDIDVQAKSVIASMQAGGVKRMVFVTALGIYNEVPGKFGKWNDSMIGEDLKPFRRAADAIEASDLEYTIVRPAWLQDEDEISYETTEKGTPFKGTEVSRRSVADLIVKIIHSPQLHLHSSMGVNKPGTEGDKPSFY